jgi:hypothetical protein
MQVKCLEIELLWGFGVDLEESALWRCARAHSVVVSVFLCFSFCLHVCFMQRVLTCEGWGLRGLFERLGLWKSSDLWALRVEKLGWEVWRCQEFQKIWLEWYECRQVDLKELEVLRGAKDLTWVLWVWKTLVERFGGVKRLRGSDLSALSVENFGWEVWRC